MKHIQIIVLFTAASMFSINSISVGTKLVSEGIGYRVTDDVNDFFCAEVQCGESFLSLTCHEIGRPHFPDKPIESFRGDVKIDDTLKTCLQANSGDVFCDIEKGPLGGNGQLSLQVLSAGQIRCQDPGKAFVFPTERSFMSDTIIYALCIGPGQQVFQNSIRSVTTERAVCTDICSSSLGDFIFFYDQSLAPNSGWMACKNPELNIQVNGTMVVGKLLYGCIVDSDQQRVWVPLLKDQKMSHIPPNFDRKNLFCTKSPVTWPPGETPDTGTATNGDEQDRYSYWPPQKKHFYIIFYPVGSLLFLDYTIYLFVAVYYNYLRKRKYCGRRAN